MTDIFSYISQLKEHEQSRPKLWMGAHMLNDPNCELKEKEDRHCDVCTPNRCICPSTWADISNCIENKETEEEGEEEEPEELDWDADLEEAQDYHARVSAPMRRPRQPPKVLMFQPCIYSAGWPAGVQLGLPPKPDLMPKNRYVLQQEQELDQESEYLELVQRHFYMEPTPRDYKVQSQKHL